MKVLILCGGRGAFDYERREKIPKAMIQIGNRPSVWHIMKSFSTFGYNDFVLALGEGGELVRDYFLNYGVHAHDLEIKLSQQPSLRFLNEKPEDNWNITLVDTGNKAETGARIFRCRKYLESDSFLLAYSDCLSDVNIKQLVTHHKAQKKVVTVTGVQPPSRFGTFFVDDAQQVTGYSLDSKLIGAGGYINGGFMAIEPSIFEHLLPYNECSLEREVFVKLATLNAVGVFKHLGFWHAIDTERDRLMLDESYIQNRAPWLPKPQNL